MPCRSVRQVTEIAHLWVVRHGAIVSAGTARQESDTACPSEPRDGFIAVPLPDGLLEAHLLTAGLEDGTLGTVARDAHAGHTLGPAFDNAE